MFKNYFSSIHNLKVPMWQITNVLTTYGHGNFPSNTETNLKEQIKAITLKSGKELEGPNESMSNKRKELPSEEESKSNKKSKDEAHSKENKETTLKVYEPHIPLPKSF